VRIFQCLAQLSDSARQNRAGLLRAERDRDVYATGIDSIQILGTVMPDVPSCAESQPSGNASAINVRSPPYAESIGTREGYQTLEGR
jgi:hypothetical protein